MEGTKERFTVEKPWLIDQILHGGIGTYRMDHNSTFALAVVKPERNAYTMVRETNKPEMGKLARQKVTAVPTMEGVSHFGMSRLLS